VVLVAKFAEGAWITILLIPALMLLMRQVKRHYDQVAVETRSDAPINPKHLVTPLVAVPLESWGAISQKALRFAWTLSPDIHVLHVVCGDEPDLLSEHWRTWVEEPAEQAGLRAPELIILKSPFRFVIRPILDYVLELEAINPNRQIAVLIPELVESRWYYALMHNNRATVLKALLLIKGNQRITVVNIPWYLKG
jgi:hypothetical protein